VCLIVCVWSFQFLEEGVCMYLCECLVVSAPRGVRVCIHVSVSLISSLRYMCVLECVFICVHEYYVYYVCVCVRQVGLWKRGGDIWA